ncbi:MAG: mandelate racemase/muconate lactonizing enzyme family protein [Betaproteobacteria bacterium]|nr:mandelate racemase/muconate lactonizing enzyme family protein [Betaproteobacteria bacterium]MBI2292461.1 mandelate racemase/muconate lactonizing enzyme family protein [Betaproteobacteria bacterium]MBI3052445.1 mandelate racemase/muconate lactonizing enzyme family protein [Betaproteobacteria bacterium]
MKITAINTIILQLPFRHVGPPLLFAGKPRTTMEMLLVRVDTDDGITGWGEAFGPGIWPATRATIETLIAPLCIGRDPSQIQALGDDLRRKLHALGRSGSVVYALSGLDIALWDIAGKKAGLPICRLLSPAPKRDLPAYASLLRYAEPDRVARTSAAAVARGYRQIKLHEIGVAQARAAREAIGPEIPLMMDANCPWTVADAVATARKLRDVGLLWFEEPVWPPEDYAGLATVRQQGGIPVAAGENASGVMEFSQMFSANAVDYVQPSIIKMGGITEMLKVIALAKSRGVPVVPHSAYFGPGLLATLHVCAADPASTMIERYYCDLDASPLGTSIDPVNGQLSVPQAPGLGADPDPGVIRQYQAL